MKVAFALLRFCTGCCLLVYDLWCERGNKTDEKEKLGDESVKCSICKMHGGESENVFTTERELDAFFSTLME